MKSEVALTTDGERPSPSPTLPPPTAPPANEPEQFFGSIHPGLDEPLPDSSKSFAKAILAYEQETQTQAYLLIQRDYGKEEMDSISDDLAEAMVHAKGQIKSEKRLTLILHTLGGDPNAAYRLSSFLQKMTGGFDVAIPKSAKSAGTLIALSADKVFMAEMAELSPLDMQVKDMESDLWDSALNETKALQTLSKEALVLYVGKMELLRQIYKWKKFETMNQIASEFVNEMIRPLVEKIDAVHYTKMARIMEIMKKYGKQLMKRAKYSDNKLAAIVDALGEGFPDHTYIIDNREARDLGLKVETPKAPLAKLMDTIEETCGTISVVGRIKNNSARQ